ncbi:MAG: DUF434 domain-containing protein [Abitibacteriaceae bacterium]|nr:DUF434 domain-containing protein [Abditibacteriaceae bacterium]MBV9867312.1 DUF434 domain-containing protein [Abditibacteriaceae bacterium]
MPDKRTHRGAHPEDQKLFAPAAWPRLREAVADFSWLLTHGYATKSVLALVGDRYQLAERQRLAVMRCSCSDQSLKYRREHRSHPKNLTNQTLLLDGYNVLTTVEVALSGGVVLRGRDDCYRDIASMHGTFRKVEETLPALLLIGEALSAFGVQESIWYFDSPVSNSGRLKGLALQIAHERSWNWQVEIVMNPDPVLAHAQQIIATADSVILDSCHAWFNLASEVVTRSIVEAQVIDFSAKGQA